MRSGNVDLFTSRRKNFMYCKYWIAEDELAPTLDKYDIDQIEDGSFYASEISPQTEEYEIVGNDFMFNGYKVSLETEDDISNLVPNSVVFYDDELWRVKDIQKTKKKRQSQFAKTVAWVYYINLRR